MLKSYLTEFMNQFSFEEEDQKFLLESYEQLKDSQEAFQEFEEFIKTYEGDCKCDFKLIRARMIEVSKAAGIHEYTGNLLLFMCLSKTMKVHYKAANYSEDMWAKIVNDLKWKMDECKDVYGICGTFVPDWYDRIFKLERFGFERLQFDLGIFKSNYEGNGIVLRPDSIVVNIHVPRSGKKLDRESTLADYKAAAEFFQNSVFSCHSWLAHPRNLEVLSPTSNIAVFLSDYEICETGLYDDYKEVWRLFDKHYEGDVDALPQNSSLRRAYAEWIRNGEKIGWGHGVYVHK